MAEWIVPDYESRFLCKCGDCRRSCCLGWNISLSLAEYEALCALDGPLEEMLRGAMERDGSSARFIRTDAGRCPLLLADGLCALQKAHGETLLPEVCSAYPRIKRTEYAREIALSASCEAVCELLLSETAPLQFIPRELPIESAQKKKTQAAYLTDELHSTCMRILQNRALTLADRIAHLHAFLRRMHAIETEKGLAALHAAVQETDISAFSPIEIPENDWLHIALPLSIASAFMPESSALKAYWQPLLSALHLPGEREKWTEDALSEAAERYALLKERFARKYPHHEQQFERIMVNWAFYTRLPFSGRLSTLEEEAFSLAACFLLVRFASVLCADGTADSLVDIVSACMRVIEHSGFDKRCASYLRASHFGDADILQNSILSI